MINLRQSLVKVLAVGNVIQGLDIIVRHPTMGNLIETDMELTDRIEENKGWMSGLSMYTRQSQLAYTIREEKEGTQTGLEHDETHLSAFASESVDNAKLVPLPGNISTFHISLWN